MLSGNERDTEVGRETRRDYRMTEDREMAKYITCGIKKVNPEEDRCIKGVNQFNTQSQSQYKH